MASASPDPPAMPLKAILGTMTFGSQVSAEAAADMVGVFLSGGHDHIDTAYIYCGGDTEVMLGGILSPDLRPRVFLATKVYPEEKGGLSPEVIESHLATSLKRLNASSVDLFYLHAPDSTTPIADSLEACQRLLEAGSIRALGLSNYAAWQVAEIAELCRRRGWAAPVAYQGMYNALTRDVERELLPCLRHYGMAFYAYNPLAGGLLCGKYPSVDQTPEGGRFHLKRNYRERYWHAPYFDAMQGVVRACWEHGVAPAEAALRWLGHHSAASVDPANGIVLGVSRRAHLEQGLAALAGGPLPQAVVESFDRGWETARGACPRYFRS